MRAVCLIGQHLHAARARACSLNVRADAVVGRVVDEHRLCGRVLLNGRLSRPRPTCRSEMPSRSFICEVDINRNRTGQYECVDDAAVYIARQNDLVAAFDHGRIIACRRSPRAAHHRKGLHRTYRPPASASRITLVGWHIVERLHRVDVHRHALLTEEFR